MYDFCREKCFVVTKHVFCLFVLLLFLSRQKYACPNKFCREKIMFVTTKYFCRDKTFVTTNICRDKVGSNICRDKDVLRQNTSFVFVCLWRQNTHVNTNVPAGAFVIIINN